jgi:hypothetical protein
MGEHHCTIIRYAIDRFIPEESLEERPKARLRLKT